MSKYFKGATLYRFDFTEADQSDGIPTWGCSRYVTCDPIELARRYGRFCNYVVNQPGGQDILYVKADVWQVNCWPEGDTHLKTIRFRRKK